MFIIRHILVLNTCMDLPGPLGPQDPWGPRTHGAPGPLGPLGPWGPKGPWGPLGPYGHGGQGPWGPWGPRALGAPRPWEAQGSWGPEALGANSHTTCFDHPLFTEILSTTRTHIGLYIVSRCVNIPNETTSFNTHINQTYFNISDMHVRRNRC